MIYTANEETSNWMRFVERAKTTEEQNLVAYQQGGDIYFITCKDIEYNTELLYWYSKDLSIFLGTCYKLNCWIC